MSTRSTCPSSAAATPVIAVVVPVFRHSVLLAEAIESALQQKAEFDIRIVLVNDGCKFPETDAVCRDYATAFPDRIAYIRKPNGGLSDARNTGIRFALETWPSVEAIYMLDADNRLRSTALAHAYAALQEHSDADWIYPNIDMFGLEFNGDYGGEYSVLIHTVMNTCEAGSLIRRRVFEAGVYFDTDFKLGFEDWDFFLTAAEFGFRGRNIEDFGFLYRKRPESMLANSTRDEQAILSAMRRKHKDLFSPRTLLSLEQEEAPRYAVYLADTQEVFLTTDPEATDNLQISLDEYIKRYWGAQTSPARYHIPPYLVVATTSVLETLRKSKMLHWVFWRLECDMGNRLVSLVSLGSNEHDRLTVRNGIDPDALRKAASLLMIGPRTLNSVLMDHTSDWINSLVASTCNFEISGFEVLLPRSQSLSSQLKTASYDTLALMQRMRASPFRTAAFATWEWRGNGIEWRQRSHEIIRNAIGGTVAYPKLPDKKQHIGFVLPCIEFGGVEKVALNMAKALQAQGWNVHLFVLEACDFNFDPAWQRAFSSVSILDNDDFSVWNEPRMSFLGTDLNRWALEGNHGSVVGLMHWLDAVINFHSGAFAAVMGQLKRLGITTVNSLHLSDQSPVGRPAGNTYLGLAYEHAFDYFAPCSHQLADWCHAMGIPEQKIVPVPNAPGFDIPPELLAATMQERSNRHADTPLRVAYLGRLDHQKGLGRLAAAIQETQERGIPVEWRIIGKGVFEAPPAELEGLIEPPVYSAEQLAEIYVWADVIVLLSSYEGLPLTILEAMRSGAVMIATDVGANTEVLEHGKNGLVVSLDHAASECVAHLQALYRDRGKLNTLSQNAYEAMRGRTWGNAVEGLQKALASSFSNLDKKGD